MRKDGSEAADGGAGGVAQVDRGGRTRGALGAWEASGESVNAFGRRLGIVPQRLLWWRSRLGRVTPSFVPVEVTGMSPAVVVVAGDGTRVEEMSTADPASAESGWRRCFARCEAEERSR